MRNRFLSTVCGRLLLCFLSGAVFSLPYFFEWAFPFTYIGLTAFFSLLWRAPLCGKEFRACFAFCFGYWLPVCSWFTAMYPLTYFGFSTAVSLVLVACCCLLLPVCYAALTAAVLQICRFLPVHPLLRSFGMAALWVLAENLLSWGDMAFPWATVALSQTGCAPLLKTVSLFGSAWLAFFAVTVCALIAAAFLHGKKYLLVTGSSLFAGVLLMGGVLYLLPQETNGTVSVAAIQGNSSTEEKWDDSRLPSVFETYLSLTERAAENGAELILLPESAIPVNFEENGVLHESFAQITRKYGCTVVPGVLRLEDGELYNSLVAVNPDGSLSDYYNKRHAVPFGEKTPFSFLLPSLTVGTELTTGGSDAYIESDSFRAGCFICFDSVFGGSEQAASDADFLLVSTNDAWFGDSVALTQHLRFSKLRAAESGRSLLRAGNTGISALLDANGTVIAQTAANKQAVLYGELPVYGSRTLYSIIGDLFPALSLASLCFALLWSVHEKRNNQS